MKRVLLGLLCLLVLVLAGCAAVNQTNRFVVMPEAAATGTPEAAMTPEPTQPPVITPTPALQLDVPPTDPPNATNPPEQPGATDTPEPTAPPTPAPTPTQEPEGSPGGFNG